MELHEKDCKGEFELERKIRFDVIKFLLIACSECGKQYLEPDGWYYEL